MDFGTLLQTAKENDQIKKDVRILLVFCCRYLVRVYNTKFTPPKKEEKKAKNLSVNIQKFLARKEAEEKQKNLAANRIRDDLLALRSKDKKATRRVNVMLKRTKSANQSVIEDAVDKVNTAVTLAGPSQPDEDDYGYVSQEAAAYYNKMMEKYSKIPDDPKFRTTKKKASNNLINTKDRVKAALEKEKEDALLPHRRKRKHKEDVDAQSETTEKFDSNDNEDAPPIKKKPKTPAPPALNFSDLLKLAAVKQHQPIVIEVKPKEEGPLLTKKQKKELEREQQRKEAKNQQTLQQNNKIPLKQKPMPPPSQLPPQSDAKIKKVLARDSSVAPKQNGKIVYTPSQIIQKPKVPIVQNTRPPVESSKMPSKTVGRTNDAPRKFSESNGNAKTMLPKSYPPKMLNNNAVKSLSKNVDIPKRETKFSNNIKEKPVNIKPKAPLNLPVKKPQPPAKEMKPKQFPPPDVRKRESPKLKPVMKRRIIDDEDYDSEMDDFIDDGPEEMQDYSKYIKDIFGYDKSKYRGLDDDIDNMESTFAQQMREDVRSTKLGIMEDLEDIKREREEKKQKAIMKKRKL